MTPSRLSVPMSVTMRMIVMASEPLHPLLDSGSCGCVCSLCLDYVDDIFPVLSLHCESFVEVSLKCKCCSIWLERGHIARASRSMF